MGYCKKHNQRYMSFIKKCPICVGEMFTQIPTRWYYKKEEPTKERKTNERKRKMQRLPKNY